jgi:hypothetical protein
MNEHIKWVEIEKVIEGYGFFDIVADNVELGDLAQDKVGIKDFGKEGDIRSLYRLIYQNGNQHTLNFERIENSKGEGKLTFVSFAFEKKFGKGRWEHQPIARFYMDPQNWESELRQSITLGFAQTVKF